VCLEWSERVLLVMELVNAKGGRFIVGRYLVCTCSPASTNLQSVYKHFSFLKFPVLLSFLVAMVSHKVGTSRNKSASRYLHTPTLFLSAHTTANKNKATTSLPFLPSTVQ